MAVVSLAAEWLSSPLWIIEPGEPARNVEPSTLPISADLAAAITAWGEAFDATLDQDYPPWSGFADLASATGWLERGAELAARLTDELGRAGYADEVRYGGGDAAGLVRTPPADRRL